MANKKPLTETLDNLEKSQQKSNDLLNEIKEQLEKTQVENHNTVTNQSSTTTRNSIRTYKNKEYIDNKTRIYDYLTHSVRLCLFSMDKRELNKRKWLNVGTILVGAFLCFLTLIISSCQAKFFNFISFICYLPPLILAFTRIFHIYKLDMAMNEFDYYTNGPYIVNRFNGIFSFDYSKLKKSYLYTLIFVFIGMFFDMSAATMDGDKSVFGASFAFTIIFSLMQIAVVIFYKFFAIDKLYIYNGIYAFGGFDFQGKHTYEFYYDPLYPNKILSSDEYNRIYSWFDEYQKPIIKEVVKVEKHIRK